MDRKYYSAILAEAKSNIEAGLGFDEAFDLAEHDARFEGLNAAAALETRLRRLNLSQIGYIFLTYVAESNHGSWDGWEREQLLGIEPLLQDIASTVNLMGDVRWSSFSFGDQVFWDEQGNRHTKEV